MTIRQLWKLANYKLQDEWSRTGWLISHLVALQGKTISPLEAIPQEYWPDDQRLTKEEVAALDKSNAKIAHDLATKSLGIDWDNLDFKPASTPDKKE